MGQPLDLKPPTTFTQKVQWIKLYGTTPAMKRCVDKYEFKNYIREKLGDEHFKADGSLGNSNISFHGLNWEPMDVSYGHHPSLNSIQRPKHADQMIEIARKLAKDFDFVRVDFFDTEEKLYLAELTFCPGGGFVHYNPDSFDEQMGAKLKLPIDQ